MAPSLKAAERTQPVEPPDEKAHPADWFQPRNPFCVLRRR